MKQFLAIIDGPMGSGKTTIAKLVHEQIENVALIGLDQIKWTLSGFDRTPEQNRMTGKVVQAMAKTYLQNGASILLDEGFGKAEVMQPYLDLAAELSIPVFVFQLEAPDDVLLARLEKRPAPEQSRTPMPIDRTLRNISAHHDGKYQQAKTFDSTQLSPDEIAEKIVEELKI